MSFGMLLGNFAIVTVIEYPVVAGAGFEPASFIFPGYEPGDLNH